MRKFSLLVLIPGALLAQTTFTGMLKPAGQASNGYWDGVVGQFDKANWVGSRKCYALWGEYHGATFSEWNNMAGCWSWAENRWHYLTETTLHSPYRSVKGHQWGFQMWNPDTDTLWWTANDGGVGQAVERGYFNWFVYDMQGQVSYMVPNMTAGARTFFNNFKSGNGQSFYADYDTVHHLSIQAPVPDPNAGNLNDGEALVCNPSQTTGVTINSATTPSTLNPFQCVITNTGAVIVGTSTTTAAPVFSNTLVQGKSNLRFNKNDNYTYFGMDWSVVWRIDASNPASKWQAYPAGTTACFNAVGASGGGDCTSGHPPVRLGAGFDWSTADHVGVLIGGLVGGTNGTPIIDIWKFDPTGSGTWTEICGPNATGTGTGSCGTVGTNFPNFSATLNRIGDRWVYSADYNGWVIADDSGTVYVYGLPGGTGATTPGQSPVGYAPCSSVTGNCAAGVTGPVNRILPPATTPTCSSPTSCSNAQTDAYDLSMDVTGSTFFLSHIASNVPTDNLCAQPAPFVWSSASGGTWLPSGSFDAACAAMADTSHNLPAAKPFHVRLSGTDWITFGQQNMVFAGGNNGVVLTNLQKYNGSTAWSGMRSTPMNCYSNTAVVTGGNCLTVDNVSPSNRPEAFINANGLLTVELIEMQNKNSISAGLYVVQCNPASVACDTTPSNWTNITGQAGLATALSANVTYGSLATDGSGNLEACWSEGSEGTPQITRTPQLYCSFYNVSSGTWTRTASSLNTSTSGWAISPSVTFAGGAWYVAYTEQTQTGNPQVYVQKSVNGTTFSLIGGGSLNHTPSTGRAFHPSMTADGAVPLLAWAEQSNIGAHNLGYVMKWTGSAWSSVASGFAADTTNGSVLDLNIAVATSGNVTAAWTEKSWGNLPQIYYATYSDSVTPVCTFNTTSLANGAIGTAYSQTISMSTGCASPTLTVPPGTLPNGLTLSGLTISGNPLTQASYTFTVTATDANCAGACTQNYTVAITGPALSVALTVQPAIYPGSAADVNRTNEPVTVGIPLPDSFGIVNLNTLGLTGAAAGQFTCTATWQPSGNCKWVKIRAVIASMTAGVNSTITLTNSGSGNFGGSNICSDSGTLITAATGAATFTVKHSGYNIFDTVSVGGTPLVNTGASLGMAVFGPAAGGTYPANVLCSPTAGGTPCTTLYNSASDATNSTAAIEENGPAMCVVKSQADLNDGSGHVYMHVTVRTYMSQNSTKSKLTTILRNADYGPNNANFATSYKGVQGLEARIKLNLTGSLTYTFANHTGTPTTGTLNGTSGTDSCGEGGSAQCAYLYQAETNLPFMNTGSWCTSGTNAQCVPYSNLNGYAIVNNGSSVLTGTGSQYPIGWADISDSAGKGVEIGQYQFAAYGNKSLEFRDGGDDVRVGIMASENNTVGVSNETCLTGTTANCKPYYVPYPQYWINDIYYNFHVTAPASLQAEFLKQQHFLLARALFSWYNTTATLPYPLLDPNVEDTFYSTITAPGNINPAVSSFSYQDLGTVSTQQFRLNAWKFYSWPDGGAPNQSELRYSHAMNFVRRGLTGNYLDSLNFYNLLTALGLPRADFAGGWPSKPGGDTQYYNYVNVTYNNLNNRALGMWNWVEISQEHAHVYGLPIFYLISGDETYKDFIINAYKDHYLNTVQTNDYIALGLIFSSRAVGTVLMGVSRLSDFFTSIGDPTTSAALLARGNTAWSLQVKPDLCVAAGGSNWPSGCTPVTSGRSTGPNQRGTSKVRGVTYQFGDTSFQNVGASCTVPSGGVRTYAPFMVGNLVMGLWEFMQKEGPGYSDYVPMSDVAYGLTQAMFDEMYVDDGTNKWNTNGFIYKSSIDYANANCADFVVKNPDAFWPAYFYSYKYLGQGVSGWYNRFSRDVQSIFGNCAGTCTDELYNYTIANVIGLQNSPNPYTLQTVPITVTGTGPTYSISWTPPTGVQFYRLKYGTNTISDKLSYNAGTATWNAGTPATQQNWFASTDTPTVPTPGSSSITVNVGTNGLTAGNFMLKAMAGSSGTCAVMPTTAGPYTAGQSTGFATFVATGCTSSLFTVGSGSLTGSGLTLNSSTGALTGTAVAGAFTFAVNYGTGTTGSITLTINAAPSITTTSPLPAGTVGSVSYSQQLAATGGSGVLTWSKTAGTLPPGIALSSSGLLSGIPTTAIGSPFSFTVRAADANNISTTKVFSLTVNNPSGTATRPSTQSNGTTTSGSNHE